MIYYRRKVDMNARYVQFVKGLLRSLNIRYRFNRHDANTTWLGMAHGDKELITINLRPIKRASIDKKKNVKFINESLSMQEFLCTVFHEIQHIISLRQGKFINYQRGLDTRIDSQNKFTKWAEEFLTCERYCDTEAEKMMKRYYPSIPYEGNYKGVYGKAMVYRMIVDIAEQHGYKAHPKYKRYVKALEKEFKDMIIV